MTTATAFSLRLPEAAHSDRQKTAMDDRQLVQGMLAGDERAFERFSDHYIPALYRFALFRLKHDRELTNDIVQNTICKAIAKLSSFRGEAALMTWLCACCRWSVRDRRTTHHVKRDQARGGGGHWRLSYHPSP